MLCFRGHDAAKEISEGLVVQLEENRCNTHDKRVSDFGGIGCSGFARHAARGSPAVQGTWVGVSERWMGSAETQDLGSRMST